MTAIPPAPSVTVLPHDRPVAPQRKNVVRIANAWYVACEVSALRHKPVAVTILGVPLVLFRDRDGVATAVVDRCPHRNVPLSLGRMKAGELECPYHGWRFGPGGVVTAIPGLVLGDGEPLSMPGRNAVAHACVEASGYVWVWLEPHEKPLIQPFALPHIDDAAYHQVRRAFVVRGTLHSTLENILDVPHTAFLHGGLFRTEVKRHEIEAVVTRAADHVQAEFRGEPRPTGWAARILAPNADEHTMVEHYDRFYLPSIAQVEYRLTDANHIVVTTCCTPVDDTTTVMHATVAAKTRLPISVVAQVAMPVALRILKQDKEILEAQTRVVDHFGTESFSSTPIDLLGPHILHLLKKAEARDLEHAVTRTEHVRMRV